MKKIIICMSFCFILSVNAQVKDSKLVLTRTIAQLANQDNKLLITVAESGQVELNYPRYHKFFTKKNKFNNHFSKSSAKDIFQLLDFNWTTDNIQSQLKSMKSNNQGDLFYNSEPDLLHLSYLENDKIIWQIDIPDYLAIKYFNKANGNFDRLINLIDSMQNLSTQYLLQNDKEIQQ